MRIGSLILLLMLVCPRPAAASGSLKVTSFPSGAEVLVDGVPTGKVTPMSVSLTEGDHSITVQIPNSGWRPDTRIVTIVAGNNDLSVTLLPVLTQGPPGVQGPKGDKGDPGAKGDKGDKGDPGDSFDIAVTDARYAKLLGDNSYTGSQNVAGTVTATRFVGDGSGLTNVTVAPGLPCEVIPAGGGRTLVGRDPHLSDPDHPADASNCAVPDGSNVQVLGPRPSLSGARIVNVPVSAGGDWSFADLSRAELLLLSATTMVGANLRGAILHTRGGHDMRFVEATGASFIGLVAQVIADDARMPLATFDFHEAPGSTFNRADLRSANFAPRGGQTMTSWSFVEANLSRANLARTRCVVGPSVGCNFTRATLRGANLRQLNCATTGSSGPRSCDFTGADLTGADLTGASLQSAILDGVMWSNTICPDGSNSGADDGDSFSCLLNLAAGPPPEPLNAVPDARHDAAARED